MPTSEIKTVVRRAPELVERRILDAAEAEFLSVGYEAASTNRITAAFGGSKATLFRHYPTKQDLLGAVIRRVAARWRGAMGDNDIAHGDPARGLLAFAERMLDWILSEDVLAVGRLGIAEGRSLPELSHVFTETAAAPLEAVVADQLRRWTAEGKIASADPAGDAVHFLDLVAAGPVSRALYGVGLLSGAARKAHAASAVGLFLDGRRSRPDQAGHRRGRGIT